MPAPVPWRTKPRKERPACVPVAMAGAWLPCASTAVPPAIVATAAAPRVNNARRVGDPGGADAAREDRGFVERGMQLLLVAEVRLVVRQRHGRFGHRLFLLPL